MDSIWLPGTRPVRYRIYKKGVYLGDWFHAGKITDEQTKFFIVNDLDVLEDHDPYVEDGYGE